MAWVNRDEQNTLCAALDDYMKKLQVQATEAARVGDLQAIVAKGNDFAKAKALEQRLYSYQKDR